MPEGRFFTNSELYTRLQNDVIPQMFRSKGLHDPIRVWRIGCGSGEDTYSLAILLCEQAERYGRPHPCIFATDLPGPALEHARHGIYSAHIENQVSGERLKSFFVIEGDGYQVRRRLRDLIIFGPHDLLADPPFSRLDLIFCCNVLDHLKPSVKRAAVEMFHHALNPNGTLLFHPSKGVNVEDLFETVDSTSGLFKKREVSERRFPGRLFPLRERHKKSGSASGTGNKELHFMLEELETANEALETANEELESSNEELETTNEELQAVSAQSQQRLEALESLTDDLQNLLAATDSATLLLDCELRIMRFSHTVENLLGVRNSDRGRPISELRNRIGYSELHRDAETVLNTLVAIERELRDQESGRWYLARIRPYKRSGNRIGGVSVTIIDITDRKRGAQASRSLSAIVENSSDAILSKSLDGVISTWNTAAEHIFGYTGSEAIGQSIRLIVPRHLWEQESQILERIRAGERVSHFETKRLRKDGSTVDIALTISPVRDESGSITGASTIARDITERKRTEEALRGAEEDLRWVFDLSAQVPWTADPQGNILDFSQRWVELTGRMREDLLGGGWKEAAHPDDLPMMAKAWGYALRTGEPYDVEHRLRAANGEYSWMRTRAYPRCDSSGQIVKWYGTTEDIHDRKLAQGHMNEMAAANRELELRNREIERGNQIKNEFVASMSHELRTPLHTILGFTDLLQERIAGELNEKQERFLQYIHRDGEHLLDLINGLLDLSKIEAGRLDLNFESLNVKTSIEESVSGIQARAAAKSITVEDRSSSMPYIEADQLRLKQILYNLLGNAIKFTPEGGRVWVEASEDSDSVHITVADNGLGIPQEQQSKIFEKFHQVGNTTSGVREGTGLGLAITHQLIQLHGGRIRVESAPGEGSRFTFTLPRGRSARVFDAIAKPS